jgi:hypothetical protein
MRKLIPLVFLSSALIAQKDPFLAHDWAPHNPQADGHCCETVAAVPAGSVTRNDSESPKSRICAPAPSWLQPMPELRHSCSESAVGWVQSVHRAWLGTRDQPTRPTPASDRSGPRARSSLCFALNDGCARSSAGRNREKLISIVIQQIRPHRVVSRVRSTGR